MTLWSRSAPLEPPAWFHDSAKAFRAALVAASEGDLDASAAHLATTRGTEMRDYYVEHAQNAYRFRLRGLGTTATSGQRSASQRYPARLQSDVMGRDGYRCRFCGVPVIHSRAQKRLHALVGPLFPMGKTNDTRHGVRLVLTATMDHVVPHSRGGDSDPGNLVTACWACNYGKGRADLAALGLDDPRDRPPVRTDWDGGLGVTSKGRKS